MSLLKGVIYFFMDILETLVFVGSMFIVVYLYILQPNLIEGLSMYATFHDKDYIFTSKITYRLRKPERGDIVVFNAPRGPNQNYTQEYIKRLIGLPGDKLSFIHCTHPADSNEFTAFLSNCDVQINGKILDEPYIYKKTTLSPESRYKENEIITIPPGHLFFMGDNRPGSSDSRVFGPLPETEVIGVVFFRYLPLSSIGRIAHAAPQFRVK